MTALVEVHNESRVAARAGPVAASSSASTTATCAPLRCSLETTARLRPTIPAEIAVVAESGIHTAPTSPAWPRCGVDAMLVGESLVRAQDVGAKVRELTGRASAKESR